MSAADKLWTELVRLLYECGDIDPKVTRDELRALRKRLKKAGAA